MSLLLNKLNTKAVSIDGFVDNILINRNVQLSVLRLDKLHPVVSGNKLYKLQYYIDDAIGKNYTAISTFGGAFSNHIVAAAYAAQLCGLRSYGNIRGEKPVTLSATLTDAMHYGMELEFLSRTEFDIVKRNDSGEQYTIPEGGYGELGAKGAAEICQFIDETYSHIICGVGTGTMIAGLVNGSHNNQTVIGISAMKNNVELEAEIKNLLTVSTKKFQLIHDYHFGGFAKHPPELLSFMQQIWDQHQLPTDIVYTAKTLFGILDLAKNNFFAFGSKIMMIHSGGLQGNRSLPVDSLPFL
jgi:1-aminocyclopropane-1-carboxylate deaminase